MPELLRSLSNAKDGKRIVEAVTGEPYLNREASFDYKIVKGDPCYNLFIKHGFEWGGEWTKRLKYPPYVGGPQVKLPMQASEASRCRPGAILSSWGNKSCDTQHGSCMGNFAESE